VKDTLSGCYTRDDGGKYCVCHTPFCNNYRIGILKIRAHKTDLLVGPSTAISFDVVEKPEGWQPEAEEDVVDDNSGVAFEGSNKQELEKDHAGEVGEQGPLADHEIVKMSASQAAETANDYGSVPLPAWGSKASDSSGLYEGTTLFEMKKDLLDKYRGNVPHGTRVIPIPPEAMKGESFPPNEKIVNLRSRPVYATVDEVMQRSREIIASGSDGRSVPSFSVFLSLVAVCRLF
jgi:hypothetical protein